MKFLNLTIVLLFSMLSSFAQQYVPMPTGQAVWNYSVTFVWKGTTPLESTHERFLLIQTGDDTTINSAVYKKIMKRTWDTTTVADSSYTLPGGSIVANNPDVFFAALREDSQKVYLYHNTSHWLTGLWQEDLLYDFTASVGDTVPHVNFFGVDTQDVIIAIDSIQVNGSYRKRYHVARAGSTGSSMKLIEGIGTDRGLIGAITFLGCYCFYDFHCFTDSTTSYPQAASCAYIWPQGTPTSVGAMSNRPGMSVYPNPFSDILNLESTGTAIATLYDITGKTVLKQTVQGNTSLATSHLYNGLYLLRLQDKNGTIILTQKVLKN